MALRLTPTETFKFQVKVSVADEKGGFREESFWAICRRTPDSDRERRIKLTHKELVTEVMTGWDMVDDSTKPPTPVEFNPDNFAAFCELSGALRETAIAYWAHNVGAREKN